MFQRLARFFGGTRTPSTPATNAPMKPSAHSSAVSRFFAPARANALRSSLLAPRVESLNPVFSPKKKLRQRPAGSRGRCNRRKAQRLHKALR